LAAVPRNVNAQSECKKGLHCYKPFCPAETARLCVRYKNASRTFLTQ